MLNVDLPYLQPLLFWLRDDVNLKNYFTQKSFFMPKNDLIAAIDEAMQTDCPAPRSLWILPQETLASVANSRGCLSPGIHTFLIEIIVQCIRDPFILRETSEGEMFLDGQFMKLSQIRKAVKKSITQFSKENTYKSLFTDLNWRSDRMLYPDGEAKFLITSLEYQVKIF